MDNVQKVCTGEANYVEGRPLNVPGVSMQRALKTKQSKGCFEQN
jgi:hypothetical protein